MKNLAYIDLGSGSYILQLLIATFFGLLFAVKVFWKNVKMFLLRLFSGSSSDENESGQRS